MRSTAHTTMLCTAGTNGQSKGITVKGSCWLPTEKRWSVLSWRASNQLYYKLRSVLRPVRRNGEPLLFDSGQSNMQAMSDPIFQGDWERAEGSRYQNETSSTIPAPLAVLWLNVCFRASPFPKGEFETQDNAKKVSRSSLSQSLQFYACRIHILPEWWRNMVDHSGYYFVGWNCFLTKLSAKD